jgi:hypothetical protein
MRKIAVIGHQRTIRSIVDAVHKFYKDIEIFEVEFTSTEMKDVTVEYIKAQISDLDGIIFTGLKPYEIINSVMGISLPQIYIRHDQSILLQTIVEATTLEDYDIRSFTCDSYGREDLLDAFEGFGMTGAELQHYTAPRNIMGDNLVWELYAFHKEKYDQGHVSFCMTGVSMVYERLREAGVPCLLMQLTEEAINNGINQLFMKINALENAESQLVVLSIEIDMPSQYNLIFDNEYQLMLEKSKLSEQIYKFAELIQAAVVEPGAKNFILFSTRQLLELVTDKLNFMPLLRRVSQNTAHTVSIGIGYGKTAREAKYNAGLALNRALTQGGNQAFSVKAGKFSAAILPGPDKEAASAIADSHYTVVSQATGISINSIYRLHCIKEKLKKDCFTSDELSNEFGNTRRSMNRIIEKLVKAGYAEIDGTRMLSDSGRPTRIIRLKI